MNHIKLTFFIAILFSLLFLNTNDNESPKLKEKIITETYYNYHGLSSVFRITVGKRIYTPDKVPNGYPSWPYYFDLKEDTLFYGIDYYFSDAIASHRDPFYRPIHFNLKKDTLIRNIDQISQFKTTFNMDDKKNTEELKVTQYEHYNRNNRDIGLGVIVNNINSKFSTRTKRYQYNWNNYDTVLYDCGNPCFEPYYPFRIVDDQSLKSIIYTSASDRRERKSKSVFYHYGLNRSKGENVIFISEISHSEGHGYNYSDVRSKNIEFERQFSIPSRYDPKSDSIHFFIDSDDNIVKRTTFYIPDDCSYGGYASTDKVFNKQGQLITEKPGHHGNGTTMGPEYTIKEFKYHDTGQISELSSDGRRHQHTIYNEEGQILIHKSLSPEKIQKKYEYDEHSNLILFKYQFDLDNHNDSYETRYEHIYNDKGLLIESYVYYQDNRTGNVRNGFTEGLVDDTNLGKYLIARYEYDENDQIIKKEEYKRNKSNVTHLFSETRKGFLDKLTTYEYKYFE